MHKHLAVVGGDARQALLAGLLADDGHRVSVGALERCSFERPLDVVTDLSAGLAGFPVVLLPLPVQRGEDRLNAPLSNAPCSLSALLDGLSPGTLVLAGKVPFAVHARAVRDRLRLVDYLARDELAIRNAVPTAEGAIQLAMEQTDVTLHGSAALVIGYGRIGAVLSGKLAALGARVTVSARKPRDLARIEAAGLESADTCRLIGVLERFPLIFNTVPAPILGAAELGALRPGTLIIDLASRPGGIEPGVTPPAGIRVIEALSLPGKVAPTTAAIAIRDTVYSILTEEGSL